MGRLTSGLGIFDKAPGIGTNKYSALRYTVHNQKWVCVFVGVNNLDFVLFSVYFDLPKTFRKSVREVAAAFYTWRLATGRG